MNTYSIYYTTEDSVPAPYAHQIQFDAPDGDENFEIKFKIQFMDREDLDSDEIMAEGFTENDDFEWNGKLHECWQSEFQNLLNDTKVQGKPKNFNQVYIAENNEEAFAPMQQAEWVFFIQNVTQAVFETAGKELPYEMQLVQVKDGVTIENEVIAKFLDKSIKLKNAVKEIFDWDTNQKLMEVLYQFDNDLESVMLQKPTMDGLHISMGDGLWYTWKKSLKNYTKNSKLEEEFMKQIQKLLNQ